MRSNILGDKRYSVDGLKNGSKRDYELVYNEFYGVLYSLALSFVGSTHIAEEIVQDTFLKLWERRSALSDNTNILNYLYTITKNGALNHLRQREMAERTLRDYLIPELQFKQKVLSDLPDSYGEFKELVDRIEMVVDALPDDIRTIFQLSKHQGLTYAEIADLQGISVKTVEAKMSKALKKLRVELADYFPLMLILFGIR